MQYKNTIIVGLIIAATQGVVLLRSIYPSIILESSIFLISMYLLIRSAHLFIESSINLGDKLGLSKFATGVLIIAIGTSAPEFFSSAAAAIRQEPDMVIGNIFGTVIANTLLGIGIAALVAKKSVSVHKDVFGTQMSVFLAAVLLSTASLYDGSIDYYDGIILLIVLVFYIRYVVQNSSNKDEINIKSERPEVKDKKGIIPLLISLLFNLAFLFISGDLVVSSLIEGSLLLGISNVKVAATILAVGTSIPEIATAIALIRQNNADTLFGEIIGSNIFDILGVLGFISLFLPLTIGASLLLFLSISMFAIFFITNVIIKDRNINFIEGIILVSLFLVFVFQLANL